VTVGLRPGDAVEQVLPHDFARHSLPGGQFGFALGQDFQPAGAWDLIS
jgi:hypothetical protein